MLLKRVFVKPNHPSTKMSLTMSRTAAQLSAAVALCAFGQAASAHTTIRDIATEGAASYNAVQIGHGCTNERTGKTLPVIANSVVIPSGDPVVQKVDSTGAVIGTTTLESEFTYRYHDGTIKTLTGLGAIVRVIADKNVFSKREARHDANDGTIGWHARGGALATDQYGLLPFRVGSINFGSSSCAKSLKVKIPVADICTFAFPPRPGTANLWINNTTAKFSNPGLDGVGTTLVDGADPSKGTVPFKGYPATLTINRRAGTLPASCGTGYDVVVWASDRQIDAELPFPGWR
jgi:hypothetical protein